MAWFKHHNEKITYTWSEMYDIGDPKTSNHFSRSALNGREFWIEGNLNPIYDFDVSVYKANPKPAKAIIEMTINDSLMKRKEVNDWVGGCKFKFLSLWDEKECVQACIIKVECTITWKGFNPEVIEPEVNLYKCMSKYFLSQEFSDVTIVINGEKLPAHKNILASQSAVFFEMVQKSKESCIVIDDISLALMKKIMKFLYAGELPKNLTYANLLELLVVADKYKIESLKLQCEFLICTNMTLENVLSIYEHSTLYKLSELRSKTLNFMLDNKSFIVSQDNFKKICGKYSELLNEFDIEFIDIIE